MAKPALTTLNIDTIEIPVELAEHSQCGGVLDQFVMSCSISARDLTNDGFVIEVHSFIEQLRHAFSSDGMLVASCEALALGVVHVAHRILGSRLEEMAVTVHNLTGSVDVNWQYDNAVPKFPRLATREEYEATMEIRRCSPNDRPPPSC